MKLYPHVLLLTLLYCSVAAAAPLTMRALCRQDAEEAIQVKVTKALKDQVGEQAKVGKFGFVNEKLLSIHSYDRWVDIYHDEKVNYQTAYPLQAADFGKSDQDHMILYFGVDALGKENQTTERFIGYVIMKIAQQALIAGTAASTWCELYEVFAARIEKRSPIELAKSPLLDEIIGCHQDDIGKFIDISRHGSFPPLMGWSDRTHLCTQIPSTLGDY